MARDQVEEWVSGAKDTNTHTLTVAGIGGERIHMRAHRHKKKGRLVTDVAHVWIGFDDVLL